MTHEHKHIYKTLTRRNLGEVLQSNGRCPRFMKLDLHDVSYGENFSYGMNDPKLGNDLTVMFDYLENYRNELIHHTKTQVDDYAKQIVWKARINEIRRIQTKYDKLIAFAKFIEGEENGL